MNKELACAFTGHRRIADDLETEQLEKIIRRLALVRSVRNFYCGMAVGFDMLCAKTVLKLKKEGIPVRLYACIPCPEQASFYAPEEREEYDKILQESDEISILSPHYSRGCMLHRDRYMVDRADVVVCYLRQPRSGTAYTVRYAEKIKKEIIRI